MPLFRRWSKLRFDLFLIKINLVGLLSIPCKLATMEARMYVFNLYFLPHSLACKVVCRVLNAIVASQLRTRIMQVLSLSLSM